MPPIAWRLETHASLPSTSDHCIAAAESGAPAGLAVLALTQTRARGSHGRAWQSPPGNLSLSVLLRPEHAIAEAGIWPLLAGLAVADALAPLLPDSSVLSLKWPNDILLAGRKLGGILIDVAARPDGQVRWLVIGCGVNLASAPVLADRPTACLRDAGITPPTPEIFAGSLLTTFDHWSTRHAHEGTAAIHAAWCARAHPLGTKLSVRYAGQHLEGTFSGLSEQGHLLLSTATGLQKIPSGDVLLAAS